MNPALVMVILSAIETAIRVEPQIEAMIRELFAEGTPTPEQFAALRTRVESSEYKKLVPHTQLTEFGNE